MEKIDPKISLEEIRKAQSDIADEMTKGGLSHEEQLNLEKASLHLRNMERQLVASNEKSLISTLKKETGSLRKLTEEMKITSKRLTGISRILRKVVKITGHLIDLLDLVKLK